MCTKLCRLCSVCALQASSLTGMGKLGARPDLELICSFLLYVSCDCYEYLLISPLSFQFVCSFLFCMYFLFSAIPKLFLSFSLFSSSCFRATCLILVNFNVPSLVFPVEDDLFLLGYSPNNYIVLTTAFPGYSKNN